MKRFDRWVAPTIQERTEETHHLLAAAEATRVSHFVAQSYGGLERYPPRWMGEDRGRPAGRGAGNGWHRWRLRWSSRLVARRYGALYGPGARSLGELVVVVRRRQYPLSGTAQPARIA